MWYDVLIQIVAAVFAVFGLCCAVRMTVEDIFLEPQPIAVTVREDDSAESLSDRIFDARQLCRRGGIVLLVPRKMTDSVVLRQVGEGIKKIIIE